MRWKWIAIAPVWRKLFLSGKQQCHLRRASQLRQAIVAQACNLMASSQIEGWQAANRGPRTRHDSAVADRRPHPKTTNKLLISSSVATRVDFVARIFAHIPMMRLACTTCRDKQNDGRDGKQDLLFHQLSFNNKPIKVEKIHEWHSIFKNSIGNPAQLSACTSLAGNRIWVWESIAENPCLQIF